MNTSAANTFGFAASFSAVMLVAALLVGMGADAQTFTLPPDRATTWDPGVTYNGGIPSRPTCDIPGILMPIQASDYGNGTLEASGAIQNAIDACPAGTAVLLSSGTFLLNNHVLVHKGITLSGMGPTDTILKKTNGAVYGSAVPVDPDGAGPLEAENEPIVILGPSRWPGPDESTDVNLTADAVKGATSVQIADATGFAAGQFVILDEDHCGYNAQTNQCSNGSWKPLPQRNFDPTTPHWIWATDRVVWQRHNPCEQWVDDPFPRDDPNNNCNTIQDPRPESFLNWYSRFGRVVNEIKEVQSVSGSTVTFTTPIHIGYRTANAAQLTRFTETGSQSGGNSIHVQRAGLENMQLIGGSDGAVRLEACAYCWVKDLDITIYADPAVAINHSFRGEVRDSYIHKAAWSVPGGRGYAFSSSAASAEWLLENNVIHDANKVMVARASGAGSVIAYNYVDQAWIRYNLEWMEVHLNGSHAVGPHHMLFEGNLGSNYDSDNTHGSSIYQTIFRNHLTGRRTPLTDPQVGTTSDLGNVRAAGLAYGSYWHSLVGNVLGESTMQISEWAVEDPGTNTSGDAFNGGKAIWRVGYEGTHQDQQRDPDVVATVLREGNYNYVSNSLDTTPGTLPNSYYLSSTPPFFGTCAWPWVNSTGTTKLEKLPAKERYDEYAATGEASKLFTMPTACSTPSGPPVRIGSLGTLTNRDSPGSAAMTVPSDATMVIVAVTGYHDLFPHYFSNGSLTLGGQTMTAVAADGDATKHMGALFYLVNPPIGNQTLAWDWLGDSSNVPSAGARIVYGFYKGVDTASPVRSSSGTQQASNPHATGSLAALSGDLIVAWVAAFSGGEELTFTWQNAMEVSEFSVFEFADGAWAETSPTGAQTVSANGSVDTDAGIAAIVLK
jgi:hypothetical protein